jgi:acyl-CoA thioester hydrolase
MTFNWPIRVYYEDTDSGGVVYYANYLKYMERARTEYLRSLGFEQDGLIKTYNVLFAVRRVELDYLKPARFNELLEVRSDVIECKKASLLFEQQVYRVDDNALLCTGQVKIACLLADSFKPCAIPSFIMEQTCVK